MSLRLFLIDAIGPFFRDFQKRRINWSKIPFTHLSTEGRAREEQWSRIQFDLRKFAQEVSSMGYNAVTLDDLAHLTHHPLHEPEITRKIHVFREEFAQLFEILREFDLKIYLTSDIIPLTPAVDAAMGGSREKLGDYFVGLVNQLLEDFPEISGLIVRIGESDGVDVKDPIYTRLHLTSPAETNAFLRRLIPIFEGAQRDLILRTWTVGAYPIGDLIWHRQTLAEALEGIDSSRFIVSMKHGESDFFRYLPLNRAFFRVSQQTIIELQARREYEGAGECPAPIGRDCERFAKELSDQNNLVGMSVWCQTGGWHRFRRLSFLEDAGDDSWVRLNVQLAIGILRDGLNTEETLRKYYPEDQAAKVAELLDHAETVFHDLIYVEEFAKQKLFFRRVRIPPILHLYWDSLFVNHAVRKLLRHFVSDPERALKSGEAACSLFPRMQDLASETGLPVEDIEHWRDFCHIIKLARRYYLLPFDPELVESIKATKAAYKKSWPRESRERYRIKLSFTPFKMKRRTLAWVSSLLLRRRRGYRMVDQIFTLNLLGMMFRVVRRSNPKALPKFLRKSAMGVETLFR